MDFTKLHTPKGYKISGLHCGIKASGKKDISVLISDRPANAVGVFTTNKVQAAPVMLSKRHLDISKDFRAIVVSSGNANAATGEMGLKIAESICEAVSGELECEKRQILIAQTGLIGIPLSRDVVVKGAKDVVTSALKVGADGWLNGAEGMMTTDTHPKCASERVGSSNNSNAITITGIAKGVAMAAPSMATMIATVATDADIPSGLLIKALRLATVDSFHQLNIDGCQSTNDTVFLIANGASGAPTIDSEAGPVFAEFVEKLTLVCRSLAVQMAGDAEGKHKLIRCIVNGAKTKEDAQKAARQVVGSVLVKCAIAGECGYWGRVIAEIGASQADIDPLKIDIRFGDFMNCQNGVAKQHDVAGLTQYMKGSEILITVDLNVGSFSGEAFGSDMTHEYVTINMEKS